MKTISYTDKVLKMIADAMDKNLIDSADTIQDNIKVITPVKTGRLRESIERSQPSDGSITVGTDVEYGKFVELGTVKMQPRFFMTRGTNNSIAQIKTFFSRKIS